MKVAFVDTSALVVVAFGEKGHARMARSLGGMDRLYGSSLLESELSAVLEREGVRARAAGFLDRIRLAREDRRLTPEINVILGHGYLRGADLHHLAVALFLFPDPAEATFLTADSKQRAVARALGFACAPM